MLVSKRVDIVTCLIVLLLLIQCNVLTRKIYNFLLFMLVCHFFERVITVRANILS